MKITLLKLRGELVDVDWETTDEGVVTKHSRRGGEGPDPELVTAISEFREDFAKLMEVPEGWVDTVTPVGLTVQRDDGGAITVNLSFRKRFKSGRSVGYAAPPVRERTDHTQTGNSFMSDELATKVKHALTCGERYVEGARAQTEAVD